MFFTKALTVEAVKSVLPPVTQKILDQGIGTYSHSSVYYTYMNFTQGDNYVRYDISMPAGYGKDLVYLSPEIDVSDYSKLILDFTSSQNAAITHGKTYMGLCDGNYDINDSRRHYGWEVEQNADVLYFVDQVGNVTIDRAIREYDISNIKGNKYIFAYHYNDANATGTKMYRFYNAWLVL